VIEDGFYYDFAFERPSPRTTWRDREAKMDELVAADIPRWSAA
jgi:threonyl-tRNA synthetase